MGISTKSNLIGGEVFGSLPRGMSMEQRQSVRDSVGMSASLSQLGSLPAVRFPLNSTTSCCSLLCTPYEIASSSFEAPDVLLYNRRTLRADFCAMGTSRSRKMYFSGCVHPDSGRMPGVLRAVFESSVHHCQGVLQDRLDAPSLYAQQLRRTVLKGAVVVFITAGYSGKRFIFERCKELGVRSVVIDGPDSWSEQLVVDGLVEDFVALDFGVADTLFERLLETCRQVRSYQCLA